MKTLPKHSCICSYSADHSGENKLTCLSLSSKARENDSISEAKRQDGRADTVSRFKSHVVF